MPVKSDWLVVGLVVVAVAAVVASLKRVQDLVFSPLHYSYSPSLSWLLVVDSE